MRRYLWLAVMVLVSGLLTARGASAQGYGVYEQNACTMGRAGTAVAAPCDDGSAIFFNPAGLAKERRMVVSFGGTLVGPGGGFTNDDTGVRTDLSDVWSPVPAGYFAMPLGEKTTVGLGIFVPYGLETRWPDTFEGRFLGYKSLIQAPYIQPTVAFKVSDTFYIGGGLDIVYTNVELERRVDLSTQQAAPGVTFAQLGIPPGTDFADVNLVGNSWGYGAHVGVLIEPSDKFSIGARYLSQVTIETDEAEFSPTQIPTGRTIPVRTPAGIRFVPVDPILAAQFAEGGQLAEQSAATELTHPDQFVVGVAFKVAPAARILFDYQWVNWEDFDEVVITTENGLVQTLEENYDNTSGFRFGAEFDLSEKVALRGGILAHNAGAPDESVTPNLPEGERVEFTVGLGAHLTENLWFDFAYQYLDQEDREGRSGPLPNNGVYEFSAHLFGFGLAYRF